MREGKQFYICAVGHDLVLRFFGLGSRRRKEGGRNLTMRELVVSPPVWVPTSMTLDGNSREVDMLAKNERLESELAELFSDVDCHRLCMMGKDEQYGQQTLST